MCDLGKTSNGSFPKWSLSYSSLIFGVRTNRAACREPSNLRHGLRADLLPGCSQGWR